MSLQEKIREKSWKLLQTEISEQPMQLAILIKVFTALIQGPVFQSVVSLMSSLRVISLTILADSLFNILIFFTEKNVSSFCTEATHIFSSKNFSIFANHCKF